MNITTVQQLVDLNNVLKNLITQSMNFNYAVTVLDSYNYIAQRVDLYNRAFMQDPIVSEFKQLKEQESHIAFNYCQKDGSNKPITNSDGLYIIDKNKLTDYQLDLQNYYASLNRSVKELIDLYGAVQAESLSKKLSDEESEKIDVDAIYFIIQTCNLNITPNQLNWFRSLYEEGNKNG